MSYFMSNFQMPISKKLLTRMNGDNDVTVTDILISICPSGFWVMHLGCKLQIHPFSLFTQSRVLALELFRSEFESWLCHTLIFSHNCLIHNVNKCVHNYEFLRLGFL